MSENSENTALQAIIPRAQKSQAEIMKLADEVAQARHYGYTFENISKQLGISIGWTFKLFEKWAKANEKEWRAGKAKVLLRINETYSRRLAEAEKRYMDASKATEKGFWSRHIIEITEKYAGFLKDCGYINGLEFAAGKEEIKIETEPIMILLAMRKKELAEEMRNAKTIPVALSRQD